MSAPAAKSESGIQFPKNSKGVRSTTDAGKAVWAAAVRGVSEPSADALLAEKDWRYGYIPHVVGVSDAAMGSRDAGIAGDDTTSHIVHSIRKPDAFLYRGLFRDSIFFS